jgi:hypothetical protein
MNLEKLNKEIGKAIVEAFKQLGGDPTDAVEDSKGHTIISWRNNNQLKSGALGGIAISVPGVHIPLMVGDILYLLRTMTRVAWGIGGIKNRVVHGTSDLEYILGLWSGSVTINDIKHDVKDFSIVKKELKDINIGIINAAIAVPILKALDLHEEGKSIDHIISEVESLIPGNLSIKLGGKKAAAKMLAKATGKNGRKRCS